MCALTFTHKYIGINTSFWQNSGAVMLWMWWYSYLRGTDNCWIFFIVALCNLIRAYQNDTKEVKFNCKKMDTEKF